MIQLRFHHRQHASPRPSAGAQGFTLTELLVAVALTLVLMLAVAYIFNTTSETVGTGQALAAALRQERNAKAVFDTDFAAMSGVGNDTLGLVINCQTIFAPLNAKEAAASVTSTHEADTLAFFQKGSFRRQTGNTPGFTSSVQSSEAWAWIGHVQTLDPKSNIFVDPGTTPTNVVPNTDNYYASQWTLGRWRMLLVAQGSTSYAMLPPYAGNSTIGANGVGQAFIDYAANAVMGAIGVGATANVAEPAPGSGKYTINQSRYDIAGTPNGVDPFVAYGQYLSASPATWWQQLLYRFECNSFPSRTTGLTSIGVAQASPAFVSGCSDFTVEFAGDFYDQGGSEAAGTVDYDTTAGVRTIHWYGPTAPLTTAPAGGAARPGTSLIQQAAVAPYSVSYVWGAPAGGVVPPRPRLIRLTLTMRDPNGRLADGRTSQFVYAVPQ